MTPTKPVGKFDSLCEDSKTILGDMAGMFSPQKAETKTPETSPLKVKIEMAMPPVERGRSGKDRRDGQSKQERPRRKRVVNLTQIRRSAHPPVDLIPEEGSSKPPQQG